MRLLLTGLLATYQIYHVFAKPEHAAHDATDHDHHKNILIDGMDEDFEDDYFDTATLDPEVRRERFDKILRKMDQNDDQYLSDFEIVFWTIKAVEMQDGKESIDQFSSIEKADETRYSFHEYLADLYYLPIEKIDSEEPSVWKEDIHMMDLNRYYNREYAKFHAADYDVDGFINEEEHRQLNSPKETLAERLNEMVTIAMSLADKNKDGKLEFSEFQEDVHIPGLEFEDVEKDLEARHDEFDTFDYNSDEFIDGNELKIWVFMDNGIIAYEELDHFLSQADFDEDGAISFDEAHESIDEWMDSDITDMGRFLQHDEL